MLLVPHKTESLSRVEKADRVDETGEADDFSELSRTDRFSKIEALSEFIELDRTGVACELGGMLSDPDDTVGNKMDVVESVRLLGELDTIEVLGGIEPVSPSDPDENVGISWVVKRLPPDNPAPEVKTEGTVGPSGSYRDVESAKSLLDGSAPELTASELVVDHATD